MWLVAPVLDIQKDLLDIASLETSEAQTMQSSNPPAYYIIIIMPWWAMKLWLPNVPGVHY